MSGVYEVVAWIREQELPELFPEFLEKVAISLDEGYDKARMNLVPEEGDKDMRAKLMMTVVLDKMQEKNLSLEEAKLVVRKMNKIAMVDFDYQSEFP